MRLGILIAFILVGVLVGTNSLSVKLSDATYIGCHNATFGVGVLLLQ